MAALLHCCTVDIVIDSNLVRAWSLINNARYKRILCTISGGSDSDIVADICNKCDVDNKIDYVYFDTGLEYAATKTHLKDLELRYGITIKVVKAQKPIPLACAKYGQPFLSKRVSDYIGRLQRHGFRWEDEPFEVLVKKYCRWEKDKWVGCYTALKWWTNAHESSLFNISHNKYLKEFIIQNPPGFKISADCCNYAKKAVLRKLLKESRYDLNIFGVRKAEGGTRAQAYQNCFSSRNSFCDEYRPVFWYTNATKIKYNQAFQIQNSDCYTKYGLSRTGCAGCPCGKDFEYELQVINKYEPALYRAVMYVFGDSYEYYRKYKRFCEAMRYCA